MTFDRPLWLFYFCFMLHFLIRSFELNLTSEILSLGLKPLDVSTDLVMVNNIAIHSSMPMEGLVIVNASPSASMARVTASAPEEMPNMNQSPIRQYFCLVLNINFILCGVYKNIDTVFRRVL